MIKKDLAHLPKFILSNIHVVLVVCLAMLLFLYSKDKNELKLSVLKAQYDQIAVEIKKEEDRLQALELALKSQSDPEYIELMLKSKLGVKREGEELVVFKEKKEKA